MATSQSLKQGVAGAAVTVIGAGGNIGSALVPHLARTPGLRSLRLIDPDRYEARNLRDQSIVRGDVGEAKVEVLARRVAEIDADLAVDAIADRVRDVPLGLLRTDVVMTCLDTRGARLYVNRATRLLGVPWWIDAGIEPDDLLVRLNVFRPGPASACYECGWSAADYGTLGQRHLCLGDAPGSRPTGAPSSLGALAASLQALELHKILGGPVGQVAVDRQITMGVLHHTHDGSALRADPACRCPHEPVAIKRLESGPGDLTIGAALGGGAALRAMGRSFTRTAVCASCRCSRPVLTLEGRQTGPRPTCPECGQTLRDVGFDQVVSLAADDLEPAGLGRTLEQIGFRPGDVFAVTHQEGDIHYELAAESR